MRPKPPGKAKAEKPGPHPRAGTAEPGDRIYFQHPQNGPMAARVLAAGKDGCTAECERGRRHAVPWDRMLGHKSRVPLAMKVLDAGAEGAIVQDHRGKRRFLAGDMTPEALPKQAAPSEAAKAAPAAPARRDPLLDGLDKLAKAIDGGAMVLMLKAGQIANAPGLALRDVTDKAGRQTKRWMRAAPDMPAADKPKAAPDAPSGQPTLSHGDTVTFRHGEVSGKGVIVASGRDGVTVRDAQGQTHQVRHEALMATDGAAGKLTADKMDNPDHRPSSVGAKPEPTEFSAAAHFAEHDAPDQATVEGVLTAFPPDTAEKMAAIVQRLRGVTETKTEHMRDGAYSPERQKLHMAIVDKFLSDEMIAAATPAEGEKPTFTILGGRGGSGKSWFNGKVFDPKKAIVLDADEIKHMLPEYEGWNAFQVHEESGDLFDAITEKALALGLNIVHDATMKTPARAVALVKGFKEAGYKVAAHYMHLPRAEAAKRAVKRFLGPTGRFVPPEVILGNTKNEAAFDQVKALADVWSFRDNQNRDDNGPTLIAESPSVEGPEAPREGAPQAQAGQDSGRNAGQDGRDGRPPAGKQAADRDAGAAGKGAGGPLRKAVAAGDEISAAERLLARWLRLP